MPQPFRLEAEGRCDLETAYRWAETHTERSRILPVVREQDRPWWREILAAVPATNIVEEPLDRGSGPGLLVATLRLSRWDPRGEIALLSIDGQRTWTDIFLRAEALLDANDHRSGIRVDGAVALGTVTAFVEVFARAQPELFMAFCRRPNAIWDLASVYPYIEDVDVWSEVLDTPSAHGFRLTPAPTGETAPA